MTSIGVASGWMVPSSFPRASALVLSSSDPEELAATGDRVLCLCAGEPPIELEADKVQVSAISAAIT